MQRHIFRGAEPEKRPWSPVLEMRGASANEELVTSDLGVGRSLAKSSDKELRPAVHGCGFQSRENLRCKRWGSTVGHSGNHEVIAVSEWKHRQLRYTSQG